ncbi:hypothetical protein AZH52_11135 [Proteus mirabilis]|nr:hypothetical protein AZH52_11135 [Proteus mirabilis]
MVGCKDDLIQNNGLIFQYNSPIDLINKIKNMENNYNTYYENSKLFSLNEMKIKQIFSYIDSIKYEK